MFSKLDLDGIAISAINVLPGVSRHLFMSLQEKSHDKVLPNHFPSPCTVLQSLSLYCLFGTEIKLMSNTLREAYLLVLSCLDLVMDVSWV